MTDSTPSSPLSIYWQDASLLQASPPEDLWARIATVRTRQLRKQRLVRRTIGTASLGLCAALAFLGIQHSSTAPPGEDVVDWQGRAQVLELQLASLDRNRRNGQIEATDVEAELGDIDRRLQSAYELQRFPAGRSGDELAPLWKRRSELLTTLILARQQGLALTRI